MRRLCLTALLLSLVPAFAAAAERPNVVLIFVDDMGYGDLSCFRDLGVPGEPRATKAMEHYPPTPHIDQLAKQGIRLTQFYAASPICSPSRVGITTGRFPSRSLINSYLSSSTHNRRHGMRNWLDPSGNCIARLFKEAGYATAHFGKWHQGGGRDVGDAPLPAEYGFDESLVSFEGLGDRILPPGGLSDQSEKLGRGEIKRVAKHEQTGIYVDRSIEFIERNQANNFYLHLWLNDVHDGHAPAPGEAETFADVTDNPYEQRFFAVLTNLDRQVGRLIKKIDELGLGEKTLIVLTSDNGPTAWPSYYKSGEDPPGSTAGFRGRKWSLYEGGIRMPFMARWTGRIGAGLIDRYTLMSTVDFLPTFTSLAGIETAGKVQELDGVDMSAALLGSPVERSKPLFWDYGREEFYLKPGHPLDVSPNLAIRNRYWKLLVNGDGTRTELYQIGPNGEIDEYNNVAGNYPSVTSRLRRQLLAWRESLPELPSEPSSRTLAASGTLPPVTTTEGWRQHEFGADAVVPSANAPQIASRAIKINAEVNGTGEGVIVAQGGSAAGFALYIQGGKLKFTTRVRSQETTISTDAPAGGAFITAELSGDGAMSLQLNDGESVRGKAPSTVPNQPGDGLEVGRDVKSPVGGYETPFKWNGRVEKVVVAVAQARSEPKAAQLVTRWAKEVDPEHPLPEYPRPQMVREKWLNLNGYWDYAIVPLENRTSTASGNGPAAPEKWDGRIVVPFCPESILSGVQKRVGEQNQLWYRKQVTLPVDWNQDDRILLHFGAVDWETTVWVNGKKVGEHRGGYDPFSFDITDALGADRSTSHEILVSVWDPTDTGSQPRGKQVNDPRGIWYTPVTGIWQTVWLEPVPTSYIRTVRIDSDLDAEQFSIKVDVGGAQAQLALTASCDFEHRQGNESVRGSTSASASPATNLLKLDVGPSSKFSWWSPKNPKLFDIVLELKDPASGMVVDRVATYSALRKIDFRKDENGHNRLYLNNEPLFQYGPLDQGWWPDGLYTAPTDEALKYDIEVTKQLGFNMARKHVKVEPQRWYYWCDKLGLLVWQDMPSGMAQGKNQHVGREWQEDAQVSPDDKAQFRKELKAMIDTHRNHPCIVVWVPFNEGWGQHDTNEILKWVKEYDPTRLVDGPSGWTDRGYGDMKDMHKYPGPGMFPPMEDRLSVLGEFGGLGLPIEGHTLLAKNNWGYRTYTTREELQENYDALLVQVPSLIADGLAAAIYTQTTDVEIEVNGLMTYDRQVIKFNPERMCELHEPLYGPVGKKSVLLPSSQQKPRQWSYTTQAPAEGWARPGFDDSSWKSGPGGFGTEGTPGARIGTVWNTPDIWIRQTFDVKDVPLGGQLIVKIHHDEDAEVFLNGKRIAQVSGYTTDYADVPVPLENGSLKKGQNVIAIHCRQTGGGQYIDAGLSVLSP